MAPPFALLVFLFTALVFLLPYPLHAAAANQLRDHPSPYLAMHGQDPVHWQDWGPAAMARAKAENRLLFISSGYFACHWCHVMQQESYQDTAVARLLNAHFVPVKLDRELHPALDAYLIEFVELTRSRAGWPLNVFLTPDGHPLVGLTYAPRDEFSGLLQRLVQAWKEKASQLKGMAAAAQRQLADQRRSQARVSPADPTELTRGLKSQALRIGDDLQGGFGRQNRFPMAPVLQALLAVQRQAPDDQLAEFLRLTLDRMAGQGLRDILDGGFFRYTVDPGWQIPHFEKMLYNQALHVPLYLTAAQVLDVPAYRQVARDTLDFIVARMRAEGGGYIASFSAVDGQGVEGGSYLWIGAQLERILDAEERRVAGLVWDMQGSPNNEGGYLPVWSMTSAEAAAELGMSEAAVEAALRRIRGKLLLSRAARSLPRDTKVLAAWNGLVLSALAGGVEAFGETYLAPGRELRDLLTERFLHAEGLFRSLDGRGPIGAPALEDYVFVAQGLADWAEAAGDQADRASARRLAGLAWERYYRDGWHDMAGGILPGVPAQSAMPDSPLPSPSAGLIRLSLRLDSSTGSPWHAKLRDALGHAEPLAADQPFAYAGSVMALQEAASLMPSKAAAAADKRRAPLGVQR